MKNVLIVILSGAALAGALYFTWQKGRESAGGGSAGGSLERRMEALDKRITSLDQRLADGGASAQAVKAAGVPALRPASRPPITPPVLSEEQLNAAPAVDAELMAAVQKAVGVNPAVREALNYYVFSTAWMSANQLTVDTLKAWSRTGDGVERVFRERIQGKVSLAINSAILSAAYKDLSTAEIMRSFRDVQTRLGRAPYDPDRFRKLENADKYVDYSTSPPTIDMHAVQLDMGANMTLTNEEAKVEIPQGAIDDEWNHNRAVLLYAASQQFLKQHAPEILAAADQHAGEIPVLLARLAKP